jgi:hypothetical protein
MVKAVAVLLLTARLVGQVGSTNTVVPFDGLFVMRLLEQDRGAGKGDLQVRAAVVGGEPGDQVPAIVALGRLFAGLL